MFGEGIVPPPLKGKRLERKGKGKDMAIFVVTHPFRENGFDPDITENGILQIVHVRADLLPKSCPLPPLVVVGTGTRFWKTYMALKLALESVPVKRSPFCGSGDSMEPDGSIAMSAGNVSRDNYIGLAAFPEAAWAFINSLPENTLLCAGGELMEALGFTSQKGQIYAIDRKEHRCVQIA